MIRRFMVGLAVVLGLVVTPWLAMGQGVTVLAATAASVQQAVAQPALQAAQPAQAVSTSSAHPTLLVGSRGAAVRELQRRLNQWIMDAHPAGLSALAVDGIFGSRTAAAVGVYQNTHALVVDGIVGLNTWGSLPAVATPTPQPGASSTQLTLIQAPGTVARNSTATVTVGTTPGTSCTIDVQYPSGQSIAAGLENAQADTSGQVSWSWRVGGNTTLGTWPITITCGTAAVRTSVTVVS
jgi:Putative peptidoglycan binding domain